ncbi:hypothetical protein SAMN02745248_02713 [Hathewaya proteolytica DSM 3090]|uniref:Uncharacterized protein n=1 Tax=Hathewaya proteolytica DSM 3090 TaxID=1121331 RepID=A0A1M6T379_9CLOT|nr:hypothetical protein [Hathewaya proteolytica]SHK51391.1 hypothetical protein SAMN02745248_02713 [Hathewaya proteolytica DSM 3090]
MFYLKLDFMMKLTECKNSILANSILVDPSLISRLRSGKRKLPKNENFLMPMIKYFFKRINTEEKISIVESAVGIKDLWKTAESNIENCIYQWFTSEDSEITDNDLIKKYSINVQRHHKSGNTHHKKCHLSCANEEGCKHGVLTDTTWHYFGLEGRKKALLEALRYAKNQPQGSTIYFHTDENILSIYNDDRFVSEVINIIRERLTEGIKLVIIHNIINDINHIMNLLHIWSNIYEYGEISSFYYPKVKNNLVSSTLMIVGKSCALIGNSVDNEIEGTFAELSSDKKVIVSLKKQFDMIKEKCRPFIFSYKVNYELANEWQYKELIKMPSNSILIHHGLSFSTIPKDFVDKMSLKYNCVKLKKYYEFFITHLKKNVESYKYTEIIPIPTREMVITARYEKPAFKGLIGVDLEYTLEDYINHIKNIIDIVDKYPNYNIVLSRLIPKTEDYIIFVKGQSSVSIFDKKLHIPNGKNLYIIKNYSISSAIVESIDYHIKINNELQGQEAKVYLINFIIELEKYMDIMGI